MHTGYSTLVLVALSADAACVSATAEDSEGAARRTRSAGDANERPQERGLERESMVRDQLEARGLRSARVLEAMRAVPRHLFVPAPFQDQAYDDHPVPIGHGQTISQPFIVAAMTELVDPQPDDRVLEIGTGSGYQAAVLARLVREVYTIEIIPELARQARETLRTLGIANVTVIAGDGYRGLPDRAPFDGIVVTAAPDEVPPPLVAQLAVGAKLVIPVGGRTQELRVIEKTDRGLVDRSVFGVRFVPMTGEAEAH